MDLVEMNASYDCDCDPPVPGAAVLFRVSDRRSFSIKGIDAHAHRAPRMGDTVGLLL